MLVDNSADIVLERSFVSVDDRYQSQYEKIPLASKFGKIFQTLLILGIFVRNSKLDYQAVCESSTSSWKVIIYMISLVFGN